MSDGLVMRSSSGVVKWLTLMASTVVRSSKMSVGDVSGLLKMDN